MVDEPNLDELTLDELEAAGIGTWRTRAWKLGIAFVLLLFFGYQLYSGFIASPLYRTKLASLPIAAMDESVTAKLERPGGTRLRFVLTASSYEYAGYNAIHLDAEALAGERVVASSSCMVTDVRGNGSIHGSKSHDSNCDIELPSAIDGVRVKLHLSNPDNSLTFRKLSVDIAE